MKIYSNEENIKLISSMLSKGREPHSIAVCGEKGQGKKTLAKYIAATLLCQNDKNRPCGVCKSCRMLEHNAHPDFITAQANENGNYQVETIRSLVSDAVVKPNEGRFKVYLIPDLDRSLSTSVQVQNILLKLIEEPPAHCVIILTASSKQTFLKTIISRALCLAVQPCTDADSADFLRSLKKYTESDVRAAVACGHGNIGRCLDFLEGDVLPAAYKIAVGCTEAMLARDEYEILRSLFGADGKKAVFRQSLVFLSEIARDACAARLGIGSSFGCFPEGAAGLAGALDEEALRQLYELLCEYIGKTDSNCNLSLTMNSLSGEMCSVINRPA
ncbi:hypothetical protein [Ruminococcus sp. Marseille-P6503]|uniref:DNA polymerase III subunit n=1 Tax=Ruminococcus sp. Marseille-P6503 TaxID=2364796 RepID=UPI000F51FE19|nr:hypothetical protein [Ruminococcus sp. Marseille-P6503]